MRGRIGIQTTVQRLRKERITKTSRVEDKSRNERKNNTAGRQPRSSRNDLSGNCREKNYSSGSGSRNNNSSGNCGGRYNPSRNYEGRNSQEDDVKEERSQEETLWQEISQEISQEETLKGRNKSKRGHQGRN